jgi:hypothetical protein
MTPKLSDGRVVAWHALDGGAPDGCPSGYGCPEYDAASAKRSGALHERGRDLFDKSLTGYNQEWQMRQRPSAAWSARATFRSWIVVGVQSQKIALSFAVPDQSLPVAPPNSRPA